jgi:hypothetical protein
MKTFNLTHISEYQDHYTIFLTWGKSFEFTRAKQAKKFLSQTNRFLTSLLVEVNDKLCDLECRHRRNWLLFFHNKHSLQFENYSDDRKCVVELEGIKAMLNVAFDRHGSVNGSSVAFENVRKCIDSLMIVCRVLRPYYKRRSETVDVWQIDSLLLFLQSRKLELESWGTEVANKREAKMFIAYQSFLPFTQSVSS